MDASAFVIVFASHLNDNVIVCFANTICLHNKTCNCTYNIRIQKERTHTHTSMAITVSNMIKLHIVLKQCCSFFFVFAHAILARSPIKRMHEINEKTAYYLDYKALFPRHFDWKFVCGTNNISATIYTHMIRTVINRHSYIFLSNHFTVFK